MSTTSTVAQLIRYILIAAGATGTMVSDSLILEVSSTVVSIVAAGWGLFVQWRKARDVAQSGSERRIARLKEFLSRADTGLYMQYCREFEFSVSPAITNDKDKQS